MSDNLEYIDNYFKKDLSPEQSGQFEQRIVSDPAFAEEVAFYLSTRETLEEQLATEKKERFRSIYNNREEEAPVVRMNPIRKFWPYISAAAVTITLVARFVFFNVAMSPSELADDFLSVNLKTLSVEMGTEKDSIQMGLRLYNEEQYNSALRLFESIIQKDTGNYLAKEYSGIVYLRIGNYDKALVNFRQLENYSLYSNPAIFYQALTLMKRNRPGDKQEARLLLQSVVDHDLEGKKTAQQWLKKI